MRTQNNPQIEIRNLGDFQQALDTLRNATGLDGRIVNTEPRTHDRERPDLIFEIETGGQKHRYAVEIKGLVDRRAALGHIKEKLVKFEDRGILFAPYLTAELADRCRELDLAFLDLAGNAYLRAPGLYLFIKGEKPKGAAATPIGARGGGTATALRVLFALLNKPKLLNAPYREIVEAAGVALGAVGWVFFDLAGRGYITAGKTKRQRQFLEPLRLFDEWVTNYPVKLRPKLNPRRFRAETTDWWQQARLPDKGAYWGGEVAADRLTHHLMPATQTIYLDPATERGVLTKFVADNRLRADPTGNVELLDTFWDFTLDDYFPDVGPPILVYADLVATLDPRNLEIAKMIRADYLDNALRQI